MTDLVRLVLVSHSRALAEGVAELAGQMAPDVELRAAGGGDDGGLGTSFDRINEALADPPEAGVVVLYDLGSALLTTESAVEFLDEDEQARIEVVDAPLVEGALAAATTAQGGADRAAVAAAARSAGGRAAEPSTPEADQPADVSATVQLVNPLGLHARPAAELVRALSGRDAAVRITQGERGADARSVLDVVQLALRGGDEITVSATGPDAKAAVDRALELIRGGFGEADTTTDTPTGSAARPSTDPVGSQPAEADGQRARPGAPGRALGPLVRAGAIDVPDEPARRSPADERSRLRTAVATASKRLQRTGELGQMHAVLLGDPSLQAAADERIEQGRAAQSAWWRAVQDSAERLAAAGDELIAARAVDVRDAGAAVLTDLGVKAERMPKDAAGAVLAVDEIGPGELGEFAARGGAGIVLAGGSPTAHAVVVARGLGLPMVIRAGSGLDAVATGTLVAIDGGSGAVVVDPPDADAIRAGIEADLEAARVAREAATTPVMVEGRQVLVAANVASVAEAEAAVRNGADGVGLLRTELLLLDGASLPNEDEQVAALQQIFSVLGERPITVRVLDAGGDKPVRALNLDPQRNGFLGIRGLRWLLANSDVLHTQLRAICRAANGRRVSVMAPMVAVADEALAFRDAVQRAVESLTGTGVPFAAPEKIGVMVEIPAAALAADEIAEHADFISIGTNDLVSYTMAADRTEPGVADLLDNDATAVWRIIEQACVNAIAGGAEVAVCGEMAASPVHAAKFVRYGVGELSMAPAAIPRVKAALLGGGT